MRSDRASRDNTPGAFLFVSGGGAAAVREGEKGRGDYRGERIRE